MPTPSRRRLLLLSNSRDAAGNFLVHPRAEFRALLGDRVRTVTFVPYASVTKPWDDYAAMAREAFAAMGYGLSSVHEAADAAAAVGAAEAIVIGGGNTFHLLTHLYAERLLEPVRGRVAAGVPYAGWSAGAVVAAPTIRTTNDMPIVEPPRLTALGLVPFQINAHYTDFHPPGFQGETRAQRLEEFVEANPGARVLGLPEGTMLRVEGDDIQLLGADLVAALFERGRARRDFRRGDDLRFLLNA